MTDTPSVVQRLSQLRERLVAVGGEHVRIVAVTKGHTAETVAAAVAAGCSEIGESYAQELTQKNQTLLSRYGDSIVRPKIHFIGGLQRNKIRKLAPIVDIWQSIDRLDLGEELARRSPQAQLMVQVDLSGEPTKRGCSPATTPALVERLTALDLKVVGLMGIAPLTTPEKTRPAFALLRGLVDRLGLSECSMGMTADLEVAVQEGSTMVRVGTDLVGPRPPRRRRVGT